MRSNSCCRHSVLKTGRRSVRFYVTQRRLSEPDRTHQNPSEPSCSSARTVVHLLMKNLERILDWKAADVALKASSLLKGEETVQTQTIRTRLKVLVANNLDSPSSDIWSTDLQLFLVNRLFWRLNWVKQNGHILQIWSRFYPVLNTLKDEQQITVYKIRKTSYCLKCSNSIHLVIIGSFVALKYTSNKWNLRLFCST